MATARYDCRELVTPRLFGGKLKPSEFLSVAVDGRGNMLAGGYSMDETVYIEELRDGPEDVQQLITPILAYYPAGNHDKARIFQIYIWPSHLPIGTEGKVAAVSMASQPGPDGIAYHAALLDPYEPAWS